MIKTDLIKQALELPAEERSELAALLWESGIPSGPTETPAWHLPLVRESLAAYRAHPESALSLKELEEQLRSEG
ncbi:MAG TPA: addiction module protein [Thermoanaerobaculia bacterium]|nr:addiction module protein [Thermoanaerobaculia bacterium]